MWISFPPTHSVILGLGPRIHAQALPSNASYSLNHKQACNVDVAVAIGVTADLERRIYEHREGLTPGFAWKYGCTRLVWYEDHADIVSAIQREKSLKRWYRQWKIELIEKTNPDWLDLHYELW